jgi:CRP-like cAMP-binding protein
MAEEQPPRAALDRLNLRLHINEGDADADEADPHAAEIEILRRDPLQRGRSEKRALAKYLLSRIKLRMLCHFLGMTNEQGTDVLAATARLVEFEIPYSSVWEAGDPADGFYIVLEGEVTIQVPFLGHLALATEVSLKSGATFGEIGLLNKAHVRTAGIHTAQANTRLLYIPAELFLQTLGDRFRAKYVSRYEFLRKLDAFKHWPEPSLRTMAQVVHERTVHMDELVAEENSQVDNRDFLQILFRGHVRLEKKCVLNNNDNTEAVLPLLKLRPGSLIFEPKLTKGELDDLIENCKLDRGANSTTRWSFSTVAETSCRIFAISRHTFFNFVNDQSMVDDLHACQIRIPSPRLIAESYLRQKKWSEYRARTLVDIYSEMPAKKRDRLIETVAANKALQNTERIRAINNIVQNLDTAKYTSTSTIDTMKGAPASTEEKNKSIKSSKNGDESTGPRVASQSSRASSRGSRGSNRSRRGARSRTRSSSRGNRSRANTANDDGFGGVMDILGLKEDMILKTFKKRRPVVASDSEIMATDIAQPAFGMLEDMSVRAVEARKRAQHFSEALRVGPLSTASDRARLVRDGGDHPVVSVHHSPVADQLTEDDMRVTEPYVDQHFSHLNTFHEGLVRTALLNRLVEGKKVPHYRVPSIMGHHTKALPPRARPTPRALRVIAPSPRYSRGGGSLATRHRLRVVQTSGEMEAFRAGAPLRRKKSVAFRVPQRPIGVPSPRQQQRFL